MAAIEIGASKLAVAEAHKAVLSVLNAACGDNVKVEALITLRSICAVSNVSICNNHFQTGRTK